MLPRPPMLTTKNQVAFKMVLALACAGFLAGCKPPGPKALLDGKRLLEKDKVPEAIERLEVAAELMGTNAQAWNFLGIAYHQSGQATNAMTAYKRALAASPDLMESRLNLGTLCLEEGRAAEAKSEFTAYTLRRPNAPEGFQKLAEAEMRLRELTQADQHIRKAIQLDARSPEAWNTLGLIQLQQRRPRDAALSFAGALKQQPDFGPALLNLAIVSQQQLGDPAAALKLYRQYRDLKPRPADAEAVGLLVRQLELELAPPRPVPAPVVAQPPATQSVQTTSKPAAPVPPPTRSAAVPVPAPKPAPVESKPVVVVHAVAQPAPTVVQLAPEPEIKTAPTAAPKVASAPRPVPVRPTETKAVTTSSAADVSKPDKRSFLQTINPVNLFRRNPKPQQVTPLPASDVPTTVETPEAGKAVRASTPPAGAPTAGSRVTEPRTTGVATQNLSRYSYKGGGNTTAGDRAAAEKFSEQGARDLAAKRYAQASAEFASASQADPGWFQAHFNHAVAALEAGRIAEALAAGESALAVQPDSAEARYNFALTLKRGGYAQDAAIELERVLAANPADARAHLALGNLYAEELKRPDLARAHYLKVLELEPGHPRASAINFWLKANPQK